MTIAIVSCSTAEITTVCNKLASSIGFEKELPGQIVLELIPLAEKCKDELIYKQVSPDLCCSN
jgi:hypothetical protein